MIKSTENKKISTSKQGKKYYTHKQQSRKLINSFNEDKGLLKE